MGRAAGQQLPELEDVDIVGHGADEADVVLDDEEGDIPAVADGQERLGQGLCLGSVHAGRRLVQHEELRRQGEQAGDLQAPEVAIRQAAGGQRGGMAQPDEVQGPFGHGPELVVASPGRRGPGQGGEEPGAAHAQRSQHHVVEDRHGAGDGQVLEGAADAHAGPDVGRGVGHVDTVEEDPALVGAPGARHHVEEGRLPGAVGSDEGGDGAAPAGERHVVVGDDTAELHGDVLDDEEIAGRDAPRPRAGLGEGHRRFPAWRPSASTCSSRRRRAMTSRPRPSSR